MVTSFGKKKKWGSQRNIFGLAQNRNHFIMFVGDLQVTTQWSPEYLRKMEHSCWIPKTKIIRNTKKYHVKLIEYLVPLGAHSSNPWRVRFTQPCFNWRSCLSITFISWLAKNPDQLSEVTFSLMVYGSGEINEEA